MALIICSECGKEFSDKALACPNCGCPIEEVIVTFNENNYESNYIDDENVVKLKESGFGIASLIFAILGIFSSGVGVLYFIISAILGIIALTRKDRKSVCSTVSLSIFGIVILISIISYFTDKSGRNYKEEAAETTITDTNTYSSSDVGYNEDIYETSTYYEDYQEDYSYDSNETIGQKNALKSAESYLNYTAFSYKGLIEQLEYEQFSHEDAVYAADNCGADWYEQAAKSAKSYLDYTSFSRSGLIDQLVYEGFSYEQAEYGVDANGY